VFEGDTLHVFAKLAQTPHGAVKLQGRMHAKADWIDLSEVACSSEVQLTNTLARLAVAQRLDAMLASSQTKKAQKERVKLAVAYQLVTTDTNYLLVHARAEQDKPQSMPELHQVNQMVPAGWACLGVLTSSSANYASYDEDDLPFGEPVNNSSVNSPLDDEEDHDWFQTYLTPYALCAWIHSHFEEDWPTSYQKLLAMGVDKSLVAWLELVIAHSAQPPYTESVVVRSFLIALTRTYLKNTIEGTWAREFSVEITLFSGPDADQELAEAIRQQLETMSPERWPNEVLATVRK
jgi:Ca-activated chloride channel family protein